MDLVWSNNAEMAVVRADQVWQQISRHPLPIFGSVLQGSEMHSTYPTRLQMPCSGGQIEVLESSATGAAVLRLVPWLAFLPPSPPPAPFTVSYYITVWQTSDFAPKLLQFLTITSENWIGSVLCCFK